MANILAVLTSVFYGISDFTGGFLTKRASEFAVTGVGAAVAATSFLFIGLGTQSIFFDRIDVKAGLISGAFLFIGNVLYLRALSQGRMGVIGGTATLLVLIPLVWDIKNGQMPSTMSIIGIFITIGGVILLGAPEMKGGSGLGPVFLAAIAAVFFGLSQISIDVGSDENIFGTMLVTELVTVVVVLVLAFVKRTTGGLAKNMIPLLIVVGVTDALALWCFSVATTTGDIAIVSTLAALDPIVLAILALFFLKEKMTRIQVVAIVIVIAGSAVMSLGGAGG